MKNNSTGTETITIYGRQVTLRNEIWSVDDLKLNPDNPRIRHEFYIGRRIVTEPELEELVWKMDATKKLYRDILITGGIQNPLYVKQSGMVYEGARRKVVVQKMKEQLLANTLTGLDATKAQSIIENIPVKVMPDDIGDKEIDVLLAREHISGKYPWPAVNQAEHIYRMHHVDGFPIQSIAEITEKSRPWVYQKLKAFDWSSEFLKSHPDSRLDSYSFFEELYKKRTALKKIANLDVEEPDDRQYVENLIASDKINMAINVRRLPEILADVDAKKVLEKEGVEKAWIAVMTRKPQVGSPTFKKMAEATEALQTIPRNEYLEIPTDEAKKQILIQLRNEIEKIVKDLKIGE